MHPERVQSFIDRLHGAFTDGDPAAAAKRVEAANVAFLQDHFRALARGDEAAFAAGLADDVEMEIVGPPAVPFVGTWRGRQQVADAVRRNFAFLEDQQPEVLSVVAQGDTVVLAARESGRVRDGGRPYEVHWVQFFTIRDGRVVRFREIFDSAGMVAAFGVK